jgi:hypothetical protein
MKITLIFNGHLRHFRGNREETVEFSSGESLGHIMEKLQIPEGDVMTFFIDGRNHPSAHVPRDGSVVELIPSIAGG